MSLVGKLRVNQVCSDRVKSVFSRFLGKPGFDVLEVFDSSSPNDPSPPSKAAAVIHREFAGSGATCTLIDQVVFDYNNRDFHRSQLGRITDKIAQDWLIENGSGVQMAVHRPDSKLLEPTYTGLANRILNRNRNSTNPQLIEIFTKSKAIGGMRIAKVWNQFNYYALPRVACKQSQEDKKISILTKRNFTLHAVVNCEVDEHIRKEDFTDAMCSLIQSNGCIEGMLYFDKLPKNETNFYHAFTITYRSSFPPNEEMFHIKPEFIR